LDFEHLIDPVGGVVDELTASLDALADEDLTPLFGPALLDRLRPLLAAQNRLAAEVARTQRVVPPHLRRAVERRDRHCVFAGCGAPTHWCDVHHLIEWINGGATSLENSALLCERHHTKVHHGFRVERQPDGRWRTWRPDGTEILTGAGLRPAA
jgi:hypothetical protein